MANKETVRMIKLGEWLQDYLKPDMPNWRRLEVFQDGAKLIGVDETISHDCGISLCLEDKLVLSESQSSSFVRSLPLLSENNNNNKIKDNKNTKSFSAQEIDSIKKKTQVFVNYGKNIEKMLRAFHKYNLPWEKALNEFEKDEFLYGFVGQLRESYSELKEIIKKQDGNYLVTKSLSGVNYFEPVAKWMKEKAQRDLIGEPSTENFSLDDDGENPTFELARNYRVIVARVLFEFLILDGQNHIHFCKQCGRFTVIQRKNRKEYCSSLCRVRASNERIAQAGA